MPLKIKKMLLTQQPLKLEKKAQILNSQIFMGKFMFERLNLQTIKFLLIKLATDI